MAVLSGNVVTELRNLAKGKPSKMPLDILAGLALPLIKAALEDRDLAELERLYSLEDERD